MARLKYIPDNFDTEVPAPAGYYKPVEQGFIDYDGRRLLYTLGITCIETSCCGIGSWNYLRVEGFVVESNSFQSQSAGKDIEIETIEDINEKTAISRLLLNKYPGARIEFR